MLPINSKWNSGLVTRHFKTGDPKSSREMIICKKQVQPMRRRYFVAVCWRKHAARWQYDFTEA